MASVHNPKVIIIRNSTKLQCTSRKIWNLNKITVGSICHMGVFSGPRTPSTEGLVFALDAGNSKSFDSNENLLPYSVVSTLTWSSINSSIVTNNATTAPDGTNTAARIQVNTNGFVAVLNISVTAGQPYTFSFWVKSVSGSSGTWGLNIYDQGGGGFHNRITRNITGEWTRISYTYTPVGNSINVYVSDDRSLLGTILDGYVWGVQLERATTPSAYYPTTGTAKTRGTTLIDRSGLGNNGTLVNGPTFNSSDKGSIVFDGIDDYANIPNSTSLQITQNISLTCWLKTNWNVNFNAILDDLGATPFASWGLWITSNGKIGWYDNGGAVWRESATSVNTNLPVNICSVLNGTTVRFYINGVLDANSYTVPALVSNSDAKAIGRRADGGGFNFRGDLYYCSIYNRALNSNEVVRNFNSMRGRFGI